RRRAYEWDAGALAGAGQRRILGKETVAGMNGVDAFFAGERNDAFDIEIRLDGSFTFADQIGFVGLEAMEGQPVLLGVDGDGPQAELIGGAQDTDGDFAAIQCEEFFHQGTRAEISKLV